MNKVFAWIVAFMMIVTMVPYTAFNNVAYAGTESSTEDIAIEEMEVAEPIAEQDVVAVPNKESYPITGTCGDNLTWELTSSGTLTISGTGEMNDYSWTQIDGHEITSAPWGLYYDNVKTVSIKEGVTYIGDSAFAGCLSLENARISGTVDCLGNGVFELCSGLTEIVIPDNVVGMGRATFNGCSSLKKVKLPEHLNALDTVTFSACSSLTEVVLPNKLEYLWSYVFSDCVSLKSINLPDSLQYIGSGSFYRCSSLEMLVIPDSVKDIEAGAFSDCNSEFVLKGDNQGIAYEYAKAENIKFECIENHDEVNVPDINSTCTSDGLVGKTKCSICDMVISEGEKIPKTAHIYGETIVEKNQTDTTPGVIKKRCEVCGYEEAIQTHLKYKFDDTTNTLTISGYGVLTYDLHIPWVEIGTLVETLVLDGNIVDVDYGHDITGYFKTIVNKTAATIKGIEVYHNSCWKNIDTGKYTLELGTGTFKKDEVAPIERNSFTVDNVKYRVIELYDLAEALNNGKNCVAAVECCGGEIGTLVEYNGWTYELVKITGEHMWMKNDEITYCTKEGYRGGEICRFCREGRGGEVIPPTGHFYDRYNDQEPLCTEDFYAIYLCRGCLDSYQGELIKATGHDLEPPETPCMEDYYEHCTKCDYEVKKPPTSEHSYMPWKIEKKASMKEEGKITRVCEACGHEEIKVISKIKSVKISNATSVYNGRSKYPTITIKDYNGKNLRKSCYISVENSFGKIVRAPKSVGKYTYEILFAGNYNGNMKMTYVIIPKATTITKLKAGDNRFTVKWKKRTKEVTGYQVRYATNKKFNGYRSVTVKGVKNASRVVKKLKNKKTYYVKVRTYKTVRGEKIYSNWSPVKTVKTK